MFNDQILTQEYIRYLKGELKHKQQNLDKCLNYMRLNENQNNTLGYVYSTIFLENASDLKKIQTKIDELQLKEKERTEKENG